MSDPQSVIPQVRGSTKYERHMYYRRPRTGQQVGWIVTGGSNAGRVQNMQLRGFEPLYKYGFIPVGEENKWATILNHPDGPLEFPADQVLTLRWYREPPVLGVTFPQIGGQRVVEYRCPECDHLPFVSINGSGGILPLGNHLRITHSWDRASLMKFGEKKGIDFDAIYSGEGAVAQVVEFGDGDTEAQCPDCDWTPTEGKDPVKARRMHKMTAHKPLEVEVVD